MKQHEEHPLELSGAEMRELVERVTRRLVADLETLPEQPASAVEGGLELARSLAEPQPPEAGAPLDELLDLLFERAVPCSFNSASPGYLAYVTGGGLFQSAVAEMLAAALNRYVGVWQAAPGLVQLEVNVVRWLCAMVGYGEGSGGVLTTGGSLSSLIAVTTARRERLPEDFLAGTLYVGDQVHHSIAKAAVLAGFPARNVRTVASDERFRLRLDQLEERIAADRREGLEPFLVVASAGTTNTGAVDDLEAIADLAEREGLWLHVDGAYGGFFLLTERGRRAMRGISRADSIILDPHKGLFLPFGTGALVVRDQGTLERAHSTHADYLPPMQSEADLVDFCQISPELTRDFRGLRVWLPVKLHGLGAFRRELDEKLDLCGWITEELRRVPGLVIVAEPQLSTVAFRLEPEGIEGEDLDRLNRDFLDGINARRRVMLTSTVLGGRFALRICVLSFRTHRERMEIALEDVRAAAAEALSPVC